MPKPVEINVVKTAQMSSTLKLTCEGSVVGSIVKIGDAQELRSKADKLIGTYSDVEQALAAFKDWMGAHRLEVEL